jgi:hypothetical protein
MHSVMTRRRCGGSLCSAASTSLFSNTIHPLVTLWGSTDADRCEYTAMIAPRRRSRRHRDLTRLEIAFLMSGKPISRAFAFVGCRLSKWSIASWIRSP